ncbi:tryptophan synthase subunit alpha [Pseudonocardia spinosispora]|uniref:tryptophan synthase subunit alpha n=1 Tax=Pseudonocardia spinosispora TaxID=103441 RepID=UPI0012EB9CF1|nr:tryptophan synthase subunit alpha [Pseudonocardia spinosispora]
MRRAAAARERLLMLYLTATDPLTSGLPDLVPMLAEAGMDVLELGIPTPNAAPRGAEIGRSFARCGQVELGRVWRELAELRRRSPSLPIVLLIYPETIADVGWPTLLDESVRAGVDGLVLTEPDEAGMALVHSAGLDMIPVIRPGLGDEAARRCEDHATNLTYRTLGSKTGEELDDTAIMRRVADVESTASKPFIAGFGIRYESEVRLLAPHVAGVVIGSEFLRLIAEVDQDKLLIRAVELVQSWKAATVLGS